MRDPLLLTYAVPHERVNRGPLLYDISSGLQPMSIRDQMFRGYILVKRALSNKLLEPNQDLPILVIGGGVAGAIASLTAVENNVPVMLVEKSKLFGVQESADHRTVCPTQYDWPASHWNERRFPWTGAAMPLSWHRAAASKVTAVWRSRLRRAAKKHSALFSLRHNTEFKSHRIDQNEQAVYAQLNAASTGEYTAGPFSIVIACGGAGIERTRVPDEHPTYTGYQFWKVDPYDKSNLGLPADVKPTVLISGGGDGSLQDYLRVVCRKTAGDIYSELPDVLKPYMEQQIAKIEDIAMRSYLWGDAGELDHPIHQEVQERYHGLIVYLLTKDPAAGALERSLKRLVDHSMDRLSLKFIYPCEHFWSCYPLNRFLVLLLSEYIQRAFGVQTLERNTKLLDISPVDHSCHNEPPDCHGKNHEVTVADATCADYRDSTRNRRTLAGGPFNILIVRHGIQRSNPPLGEGPAANPYRQVMPYSSVW